MAENCGAARQASSGLQQFSHGVVGNPPYVSDCFNHAGPMTLIPTLTETLSRARTEKEEIFMARIRAGEKTLDLLGLRDEARSLGVID